MYGNKKISVISPEHFTTKTSFGRHALSRAARLDEARDKHTITSDFDLTCPLRPANSDCDHQHPPTHKPRRESYGVYCKIYIFFLNALSYKNQKKTVIEHGFRTNTRIPSYQPPRTLPHLLALRCDVPCVPVDCLGLPCTSVPRAYPAWAFCRW